MNIKPELGYYVVKFPEAKERTTSGVLLPDELTRPSSVEIVAVPEDSEIKVGTKVILNVENDKPTFFNEPNNETPLMIVSKKCIVATITE